MPKFLNMPLFGGLYCQITLPVGAVEREDVVVVRRHVEAPADRERDTTAAPRRMSGSIFWKSML